MNLGRIGHYHVPGVLSGSCQTALVTGPADVAEVAAVNLAVWQHDGEPERHLGVPIESSASGDHAAAVRDEASFHLATDCPYGR